MEKTLTFTVEDALLSPIGLAVLSGAGLLQGEYGGEPDHKIHVHRTTQTTITNATSIDLKDVLGKTEQICDTAPIFAVETEADGSVTGEIISNLTVAEDGKSLTGSGLKEGQTIFVDYYVIKDSQRVSEIQIDAQHFAGYYYVEASTLYRDQASGRDFPAELTFPNVKIQSNFTFTMASSGDPSTFTFTMDAFPGYTYFNKTNKVLCAMQIVDDSENEIKEADRKSVFPHNTEPEETAIALNVDDKGDPKDDDSVVAAG